MGNAHLTISGLEEIALDIEINLNNIPLTYVDNVIELPIVTPNSLIYSHSIRVPENEFDDDERYDMKHKPSKKELKEGNIVIIKSDEKNRGKWKIRIFH